MQTPWVGQARIGGDVVPVRVPVRVSVRWVCSKALCLDIQSNEKVKIILFTNLIYFKIIMHMSFSVDVEKIQYRPVLDLVFMVLLFRSYMRTASGTALMGPFSR